MITRDQFIEATGRIPEPGDLERVNCDEIGAFFHRKCGWCERGNLPQFMVGKIRWNGRFSINWH